MVVFDLDWIVAVNLLVSLLLPAVVAYVSTLAWDSRAKVVLLAGLNALTAALGELLRVVTAGETYDAGAALLTFIVGLVVSWLSYDQAWKKAGITTATVGRGRHRADGSELI